MKSHPINSFTDLDAWKKAHTLRMHILVLIKDFPREYQFGLGAQLQRSAISIGSNIAEGFSRYTSKEHGLFYNYAKGSLCEVQDQLIVCRDLNLINIQIFKELANLSIETLKLLNGLIRVNNRFIEEDYMKNNKSIPLTRGQGPKARD